jgi:hypothetical protein
MAPVAVIASRLDLTWDVGEPRCRGLHRDGHDGQDGHLRAHAVMCPGIDSAYRFFTDRLREDHVRVP